MAGTTTNFAIPYPSITDYVTDGATAMRSIADQVDAVLFTGSSSGNLLINGAMQVSQRSAVGTAVTGLTTTGYNTADRFELSITTMGTFTQTTDTTAPTGSGFRNSLKLACTTADASPAAGDNIILRQKIEGQNVQAVRKGTASAQTLSLSFWVYAFQTGTFIVELVDTDNSRSCSKAYTISASNTWEYKTVLFPADTTGAFTNDANESLQVNWWLGAGTTFTSGTLATTWGATVSANRAVGQTNLASSTSNTFFVTGTQLTVGSVATPFEFKTFANDLRECQRYYYQRKQIGGFNYVEGMGAGVNFSNAIGIVFQNPVEMRAAPTFSVVSGSSAVDNYGSASGITYSSQQTTTKGGRITFTTAGLTDYRPYFYIGNADVTTQFLAEL
jgi:hypothetical protein